MLGAFAYIGERATALADLASCLGVLPANVTGHAEHGVDYSFYARQESSIRYSAVTGDFFLACDIDLFGTTQEQLQTKLKALSLQGIAVAMPDEASESEWSFLVFENGAVRTELVFNDDETDAVTIWRGAKDQLNLT